MLHDFRPSPSDAWICAGCGRHFDQCVGLKSDYLRALLGPSTEKRRFWGPPMLSPQPSAYFRPAPEVEGFFKCTPASDEPQLPRAPWREVRIDEWREVRRPYTPLIEQRIEELVARVALLRLEANDDPARRAVYESWAAYDAAMAQASYMERHDKTIREIQELERWRTL